MSKVVLITGSAVRLGREIALHLAEKGWDLALHYRTSASEIAELIVELKSGYPTLRFQPFMSDLEDVYQTQFLIKKVVCSFGRLDMLINNGSVFEPSPLRNTSVELLLRQTKVNYISPFILMRDFAGCASNGQIINIVDSKITNNKGDYFAYSLSKKSLWELTKMAALELAPNFRVNAIAPGAVLAPTGKDIHYLEKIAANTPMKTPTGVIAILRSIDYIIENQDLTGQLIFCDGGSHL